MTVDPDIKEIDLRVDPTDLYREDVFTDRKMGTIRRLTPVKPDGAPDDGRTVIYVGQAQLLTPVGSVPLAFEIEAGSLNEAIENFPAAAKDAVEHTVEELKELRRQAASSIVIPEPGAGGFGGPGGGKIQMP